MIRAAILATFAAGCAAQTGFGRAETLRPGHAAVGGGVELETILINNRVGAPPIPLPWLVFTAGYRRGVSDRLEAGTRVFGFTLPRIGLSSYGLALDGKYQLRRRTGGAWDVAVGTSVEYHQVALGTPWHLVTVTVPVLFGREAGDDAFVFGPRVGYTAWMGSGQNTIDLLLFGGSIGIDFKTGRRFRLCPELVALYSPISFNGEVTRAEKFGATTVNIGVSGMYDF